MLKASRLPWLVALFTSLFHGLLALTFTPWAQPFTKYPQAAEQYLTRMLPPERLLDFSPFYLYLHVVQQALFPATNHLILILQLLAVAASSLLLLLLLQRFVSRTIALIAVMAFSLCRTVTVYTFTLEPEVFLLSFLLGFLYFVDSSKRRDWLIAALFLALALSVRPSVLPLLGAVPLFFFLKHGRERWRTPTTFVLAPALLLLLCLGARNGAVSGDYSPLGMNPGFVFFEGNNPLSSGKSAVYPPIVGELKNEIGDQPDNPHMTYRLIAERAIAKKLTSTEANRYWRQKALNFIFDNPGHFATRLLNKGYFILHSFQRHDLYPAYAFAQHLQAASIPTLPFSFLAILALWGMILVRHEWKRFLLFYALSISQIALMLIFYVSERQRLALLPVLIFFAALAGQHLVTLARRKQLGCGLVVAMLTLLLSWPSDLMREEEHLWRAYEIADQAWIQALRWREDGRFAAAAEAAAQGYAAAPWLPDYARPEVLPFNRPDFPGQALMTLGVKKQTFSQQFDHAQLLLAAGRFGEAEVILERLLVAGVNFDRIYLQSSQPSCYLAEIAWKEGDTERAVAFLESGLAAAPGDPFILARLGALTGNEAYRQQLLRYYSEIDASFLLGMAQLQLGKGEEAARNLTATTRLLPELRRAKIYQAASLGMQGENTQGAQVYLEATAEKREPILLEGEILSIFAALASGREPQALYHYGLILAQYGHLEDARRVLSEAAQISPQPEIVRALAEIEVIATSAKK